MVSHKAFVCYLSADSSRTKPSTLLPVLISPLHHDPPLPRFILGFLKTLFLFTKSDLKTILIPVTVFAVSTAPLYDIAYLPHLIFWIWTHTLQCALANQTLDPDEDAVNKPDRPIPSGRITILQAKMLRRANLLFCFVFSAWYSLQVLKASICLAIFLYVYNDLQFNSHWLSRNILNGAGLGCFEAGATLIAGPDRCEFDSTSKFAILISCAIFVTTIHAQDFKDELGDAKIGRVTLPMMFPAAARISILFATLTWSICLACIWKTTPLTTGLMMALGTLVGVRFVLLKSVPEDQKSFYVYNVWLSAANALPAITARALLYSSI